MRYLQLSKAGLFRRKVNKNSKSEYKKLELEQRSLRKRRSPKGKKVVSVEKTRSQKKGADNKDYNVVMERAKQIQTQLPDPDLPSFVKFMKRSHVTQGFWLGLPLDFCQKYLPITRQTILLVGEYDETEYQTNFIAYRQGLSGGWKLFSLAHDIVEGDAAVFQLQHRQPSEPFKFKVHIVRLKDLVGEVDRASSPPSIAAHNDIGSSSSIYDVYSPKTSPLPLVIYDNSREINSSSTSSFVDFQNFKTGLYDSGIYSYLKEDVVRKYYDLCSSQNLILHQRLVVKHPQLTVASTVAETVEIADAIWTCNTGTPQHKFEEMENTLLAFEGLGMEVGFLFRRLTRLAGLAPESRRMSAKRHRLDRKIRRLDSEIEKNDSIFAREAAAPW